MGGREGGGGGGQAVTSQEACDPDTETDNVLCIMLHFARRMWATCQRQACRNVSGVGL